MKNNLHNTNYHSPKKLGFTLTEILIAVALFSGLMLIASTLFTFIRRSFSTTDKMSANLSNIETFYLVAANELAYATAVLIPLHDTESQELKFHTQSGEEIHYKFDKEKKILTKTIASEQEFGKDNSRLILSGVNEIFFSRYSAGLVQFLTTTDSVSLISAVHVWNLP